MSEQFHIPKSRLEAFSDGVIAIIITIMVLELKVPHGANLTALLPVLPVFLFYALSFIYVGIYWNNHHHLLLLAKKINGKIMWANLHLLFWLSLFPFCTAWVGENYGESLPVAAYGFVFFMAGFAFSILNHELVKLNPVHEALGGTDIAKLKSQISLGLYFTSIFTAFIEPNISLVIFVLVALLWAIPLRAMEKLNQSN
jgi:uncharacterized membrane protein